MANNLFPRKKGTSAGEMSAMKLVITMKIPFVKQMSPHVAETTDTQLFPASWFKMPLSVSRICAGF